MNLYAFNRSFKIHQISTSRNSERNRQIHNYRERFQINVDKKLTGHFSCDCHWTTIFMHFLKLQKRRNNFDKSYTFTINTLIPDKENILNIIHILGIHSQRTSTIVTITTTPPHGRQGYSTIVDLATALKNNLVLGIKCP